MIKFRVFKFILIFSIILTKTSVSQETNIGSNNQETNGTLDIASNRIFYTVSNKQSKKTYKKAVTEHIVFNKGIQDFYSVPEVEKNWLNSILKSEKRWHNQLLKLEEEYRNAFQNRVGLSFGQNDIAVRIGNYTRNINKLKKDIGEIRRQNVQINVDQQVYINSLRKTPIKTLIYLCF